MDPLLYLNEIKLLASLAFSYFCYRKLAASEDPSIEEQDSESNSEELRNIEEDHVKEDIREKDLSQENNVEESQKADQQPMVAEDSDFQSSKKYGTDHTQEMGIGEKKKRSWNRLRRPKNKLNVKIRKMKKNRQPHLRQRIQSI